MKNFFLLDTSMQPEIRCYRLPSINHFFLFFFFTVSFFSCFFGIQSKLTFSKEKGSIHDGNKPRLNLIFIKRYQEFNQSDGPRDKNKTP